MPGVDVFFMLSSLPLLTSHVRLRFLWGLARRGTPPLVPNSPIVEKATGPCLLVQIRQGKALTVIEPMFQSRLCRDNKHTDWGGVIIACIKYCTHPDIMSSLSSLIGWLTHRTLSLNLLVTDSHGLRRAWGLDPRVQKHSFNSVILWHRFQRYYVIF